MKDRIKLYDSVKGIAILMIMAIHLSQWCLSLQEGSTLNTIFSSGLLGVELTYLINAYFFTRKYMGRDDWRNEKVEKNMIMTASNLLSMILRLIPVYYLALVIFGVTTWHTGEDLYADGINILSHFLFINGLLPQWFSGYMGGTGYFGVLILMWITFPFLLKRIHNRQDCFLFGILFIGISFVLTSLMNAIGKRIFLEITSWSDWCWYIRRGCISFVLGLFLFSIMKDLHWDKKTRKLRWGGTILLLIVLMWKMATLGSSFDGFIFLTLWIVIIVLNKDDSIILVDNIFFQFAGKNITELFCCHIVFYYVFVRNYHILEPGVSAFFLIFFVSLVISPLLRRYYSEPVSRLLRAKLCNNKGI